MHKKADGEVSHFFCRPHRQGAPQVRTSYMRHSQDDWADFGGLTCMTLPSNHLLTYAQFYSRDDNFSSEIPQKRIEEKHRQPRQERVLRRNPASRSKRPRGLVACKPTNPEPTIKQAPHKETPSPNKPRLCGRKDEPCAQVSSTAQAGLRLPHDSRR